MGKKQHQKDKLYLTTTEWKDLYGGNKDVPSTSRSSFRRLPFDHCSLSLQPYNHPYCTEDGIIFDLTSILPYIKKFGKNPVTGEMLKKLDAKSLVRLNLFKNSKGEYHCPVTYKVFTDNSHIVAIKTTGNVFAFEAVQELNLKAKYFKDLLTDEPFSKMDIITLQDPNNLEKFNISSFDHVKKQLKIDDGDLERAKQDPEYYLKNVNSETSETLAQLKKDYKQKAQQELVEKIPDAVSAAPYSTGRVAAGLTSTVMEPITKHIAAIVAEDTLRYERVKKKGYVRLITNLGELNLELSCESTPKTCENFINLCQKGYYNNTIFHRSIKHFMIQGGDPLGNGTGGDSCWGGPFKDEFKFNLTHSGRGVLSMANSGPNTNKSQLSCRHLDNKHTVFGKVVGGIETLNLMEKIETDAKDRPKEEIKIVEAQIFVNPFEEADQQLAKERAEAKEKEATEKRAHISAKKTPSDDNKKQYRAGVGKYIAVESASRSRSPKPDVATKKRKTTSYGDFSNW